MSLSEAPIDEILKVVFIDSGEETKRKLQSMGLFIDNVVIRVSNNRWGPILICDANNTASKIAIGRNIARKIKVEHA